MPCHGGLLDIQWTATPAIEGSTSNHKHFDDTLYLHWGWIWFEKKPACREHPPGESLVLSNGSGTQGLLRQDAASNNCIKNTCCAAASYAPCVLQWLLWCVPDPVSFLGLERKRATSGILCFNLWWHRSAAKVGTCPNVLAKIIPRHSKSVGFVRTWRIACSWVAGVHLSQSALWSGTARIWFPYWNLRLSLVRACRFAQDSLTWAACFCPAPLADRIAYHIIAYCPLARPPRWSANPPH
jgi:hypothetical protein